MSTIRVNRQSLLLSLESVAPGLASREVIQQSTCVVFHDGKVFTFNDEVACSRETPLKGVEGAVKAKPLLDLLSKLKEDEIEVEVTEEEFLIRGKGKKSGIRKEAEILLPVDAVETPGEWKDVPAEFTEAISIVSACTSSEESQFVLTCVHLTADCVEATDRYQIARYPIQTGLSRDILVRGESIKKIIPLDMTKYSETDSWIHFKNENGLILSCRRYLDEYPELGRFLSTEDTDPVTLPGGLQEMVAAAEIFSAESTTGNAIAVDLRQDRIVFEGEGASGWYKEMKKISYTGSPIRFMIAPKLLLEISKKSNSCGVAPGRLCITSSKFYYTTCTNVSSQEMKETTGKSKTTKDTITTTHDEE